MTQLELLEEQLQIAEEMRGSDAPVTRMIRQEVEEMKQELLSLSGGKLRPNSNLLRYQAGMRKGQE
jgi:hypothetical protein